jgi:hypothetical protein
VSTTTQPERSGPTDEEISSGLEYCSIIDDDLDFGGTIWRHPDAICWRFRSDPKESPYCQASLANKPHLVFTGSDRKELLRIRRSPELCHTYYVVQADDITGTIKLVTTLRNKYTILLDGCPSWSFHLPLFKTVFHAHSTDDRHIWAKVWKRKQQLRFLIPAEIAPSPTQRGASLTAQTTALLPALSFIHREWWCFA